MPTPFTHLNISIRLMHDNALNPQERALLRAQEADYLLGSVIVDARPAGSTRETTHFYDYGKTLPDHPWRVMFRQFPTIFPPQDDAHHAFLAGYVAHLAADIYWTRQMLRPYFANGEWGKDRYDRFYWLHLLLIYMDERDEAAISDAIPPLLRRSEPHGWLPFMPDAVIRDWRDFIAQQLENDSETLSIFGGRIGTDPDELRTLLDDPQTMQRNLWDHIPLTLLAEIEQALYEYARQQLLIYLRDYAGPTSEPAETERE